MNRKTWNANPSRDLSYTSLVIDEQNRSQQSHKITDSARFHATPVNGNLATVVPDIEEEGVRDALPKYLRADTTTRTIFRDVFYDGKDGIADFVEDEKRPFTSIRSLPHMPLNELASVDTRIRKLRPAYDRVLGPGSYTPDPLGERATGTLSISPGEVHHTVQYARDPRRPSAVFVSPMRGQTAPEIAAAAMAPPIVSRTSEPDFSYWTSKGCWAPREERVIEADRWGRNAREMRPAAEDRPQSVYAPTVTTDGHPNSCEAYTSARETPAYKVAFSSGLPRTMALPLGLRPDTRLQVKRYGDVTAARPDVGPGSYNPEAPRLRSANSAYESADPYYSLASGAPLEPGVNESGNNPSATSLASLLPPQLQQQLAAAGTLAQLTPASAPSTPHGTLARRGGLTPLGLTSSGPRSAPSSPSAQRAAAVRAERQAAASLMASLPGSCHGHSSSRERGRGMSSLGSTGGLSGGGGGGGGSGNYQSLQQLLQPQHEDEDGIARVPSPNWVRSQTAPGGNNAASSTSASMRAAQAKQFTKLVFMQRHTPCSSLLRSRLIVTADLRKERQRLRNPQ